MTLTPPAQNAGPERDDATPTVPPRSTWYKSAQTFCRIVTTTLFDLKVYGLENFPRSGGVLVLANHQSFLDPVLVGVRLPRPLCFMARHTLFTNPLFASLIRSVGAFAVRRGEGDVGAIKETLRRLKEGNALVMYPEGTRSRDGNIGTVQAGMGMIVRRAGVPVIPAVIEGAFEAWPRNSKIPACQPIQVAYGPALDVARLKPEAAAALVQSTFERMLKNLRAIRQARACGRPTVLRP